MRGFTLPRPRSPGFGSYGCDSRPLRPRPSAKSLRTCRFPYASDLEGLRLATAIHSPARFSKRTARPWTLFLVLPSREGFLRNSCLWGRAILSLPGFRLFSPPAKGAFQLSLTVLVRYRSWDVFRVGRPMPPRFPRDIQPTVLRDTPKTQVSYAYGTFTLYGAPFQATSASQPGFFTGALQPHIPWMLPPRVQFALCRFRSPLLPASLLVSFPAGTKMFQFPAFPLLTERPQMGQEVPFGDPGIYGCLLLPRAYRSLPRPSSAPQAEPSTR